MGFIQKCRTDKGIIEVGTKISYYGGYPYVRRVAWVTGINDRGHDIIVFAVNKKTGNNTSFAVFNKKIATRYGDIILINAKISPITKIKIKT